MSGRLDSRFPYGIGRVCWLILVFGVGGLMMAGCRAAPPHVTIRPPKCLPRVPTVIVSKDITQRQAHTAKDLFQSQPGLEVRQTGGATNVYLRGTTSHHHLVLLQGMPVNDPSGNGGFAFQNLDPALFERVEIVTGARAFYEGSGALGGVIRLTPKSLTPHDGQEDALSTAIVRAEGGSFKTGRAYASLGHREGRVGALGQVSSTYEGLKQRANKTHGTRVADGFGQDQGALMISAQPTEAYGASLFLQGTQSKAEVNGFVNQLPQFTGGKAYTYGQQGILTQKLLTLDGRLMHSLVLGSYGMRRKYVMPLSQPGVETFQARRQQGAYDIDYEATDAIKVQGGLSCGRETTQSLQDGAKGLEQKALRAKVEWSPLEEARFFLSGRLDKHDPYAWYPTWQAGAGYDLLATTTLETSLGTGFKAPDRQTLTGNATFQRPNPQAKPEKARLWDVSLIQRIPRIGLLLKGTYFMETIHDVLVWDSAARKMVNRNERSIKGMEMLMKMDWSAQIATTASVTVIRAFDRQPAQRAYNISPIKTTLGMVYTPTDTLSLFGDIVHKSRQMDYGNHRLGALTDVRVGGMYTLASGCEVHGRVENLLDQRHEEAYGFGRRGIGVFGGITWRG